MGYEVNLANIAANITGSSPLSLSGVNVTASPTGGFTAMTATSVTVGGAKTTGWGSPGAQVGANTGGLEIQNGPLITNTILNSTYSPNKTIYVEAADKISTSYNSTGMMSYMYGLPNGGPSGTTVNLCYTSWSYGWLSDWCIIELFETYYLNGGYRRYQYYSGYQPTFAEITGYAFGATNMSLSNTWIGQYQNGTTGTPGTATDVTYWKGRLDITIPAYRGGYVKITTNHTPVNNMNSSYQIQFI